VQTDQASPKASRNGKLIAGGAVLAIIASAVWLCYFQSGASFQNVALHQAVGEVMAEETARVLGHGRKIIVVTVDNRTAPELKQQIAAFQKRLKVGGGIVLEETVVLDPGDNPKYRPGAGLSGKRLLKIARKHAGIDGIVSFVGAPVLTDQELEQMKTSPKLIAETHSPEKLIPLLDKHILLSAIVPRFEFPAPGPRKPHTHREWFDHYFEIVSPEKVALVKADEAP
jgi:hypothetical protein